MNRNPKLGLRNRKLMIACLIVGPVTLLASSNSVSGQTIRFFPIRTAPLGSPAGTVGDPVTPTFNEALNCWELKVPGGVEVDIDLQAFGWGDAVGSPALGAIQATVISAGYDNGVGAPLNPKGWPDSAGDGAYQARKRCFFGDLSPCTPPFDPLCTAGGGVCIFASNWVMPSCANDLPATSTRSLDYAWATAAQNDCNEDDGEVKTFGGLILEVPLNAAGTYVVALTTDVDNSFMIRNDPIPGVVFTSACITIIKGACCMGTNSDDNLDSCQENILQTECASSGGLFLGHAVACTGIVGACCLDGDDDGLNDTCVVMDRTCCLAGEGRFSGSGFECLGDEDNNGKDDLCEDVIPAVSEWGLVVMTLLLLVGIKICFARRRPTAARCNDRPV